MYHACQHIKPNGLRCKSPAMRRNAFCYFHSKAHGITRTGSRDDLLLPIAEGHAAVQLAVHQIIQALLARQIDAKEAGIMLYGIQIASQHIKVESEDTTDSVRFFANPSEGEGLALPLCIREAGDKVGHENCSDCGQRFNCNDYEPTQEDKERFGRLADLSDDETPTDDAGEEIEDAGEDREEDTERTGEEIPAEIAAQSAEETASSPIKGPASGHEFTRAEKAPNMGRALAPEECLPQCESTDEAPVSESILENVAAAGAQQQASHDPPCKRSPHAPRKRKGVETSPTIKPADAIALFKAFIKLNSAS